MQVKNTYSLPVSQKGQITIPIDIRKVLGVDKTNRIIVKLISDGSAKISSGGLSLEDVYGSVKPIKKDFKKIRQIAREERVSNRT